MNSCNSPLAILVLPPLEVVSTWTSACEDMLIAVFAVSRLRLTGASMSADDPAVMVTSPYPLRSKFADAFSIMPSRAVILTSSTDTSSNEPVCTSVVDATKSKAEADISIACPAVSWMSADVDNAAVAATISSSVLACTTVAPVVAIDTEAAAMSMVFVLTVVLVALRKRRSVDAERSSCRETVALPAVKTMSLPTDAETLADATV